MALLEVRNKKALTWGMYGNFFPPPLVKLKRNSTDGEILYSDSGPLAKGSDWDHVKKHKTSQAI